MVGTWKYYNESGTCEREQSFKDGLPSGTWITRYKEGPLKEEISYNNGLKHGYYKYYSIQGKKIYVAKYKNGQVARVKIDTREKNQTIRQ